MSVDRARNPLRTGLRIQRTPEPAALVIFGASGDLTRRKLVPALYNLTASRLLPPGFTVVGFARRPWSDDDFRKLMREAVDQFSRRKLDPAIWDNFAQSLFYHRSDFTNAEGFHTLADRLKQIDAERGTGGNDLFYLATPPSDYELIAEQLGAAGLHDSSGYSRIIIEKPFGYDLESAEKLNSAIHAVFKEEQVFRIDHYLGKETVQNILVFRFANGIFEPIWNRRYVDNVQIAVAETVGVEGRGGYYEGAGALRDIVQNHMLQLLSLTAMEPPIAFDAQAVRDEKVKVLRAIRPIEPDQVEQYTVRGQYAAGYINGKPVPGYRQEPGVDPNSITDTFVALKLYVDSWRWAGVPFYLRTGKRMPRRVTEIAITFHSAPHALFSQDGEAEEVKPNILTLNIQPDEGITLKFGSKMPGPTGEIRQVAMDFRYGTSFGVEAPEAYERLLLDAMLGDSTLFTRSDEVIASWKLITKILDGWKQQSPECVHPYEAGTWGPQAAFDFIHKDGREWRRL